MSAWVILSAITTLIAYVLALPPDDSIYYHRVSRGLAAQVVELELLFALMLWFLRGAAPKLGLALAAATGSVVFAVSAFVLFLDIVTRGDGGLLLSVGGLIGFSILGICLLALALFARRDYYLVGRARGDLSKLLGMFVAVPAYFLILFLMDPWLLRSTPHVSPPTSPLRTLNAAQQEYASTYRRGYTADLNQLGSPPPGRAPDANHADLVDNVLAGREGGSNITFVQSYYKFTYVPGPRDASGHITSYAITARQVRYRGLNYFTNQTGVMRCTNEDRDATANDGEC
ncbi:MAG: hypothetical protein ACREUU_21475 [Gammaproteobacteria bacterium]